MRSPLPFLLSAAAGLMAGSMPGLAEPPAAVESTVPNASPVEMTLADALAALRGGNPRTAADRARVDVARADVVAAGVLPNPVLDYEGTRLESGVNTGAATVDSWSVEWPVLVSGQRAARTQAAKSAASATEAHVEAGQAERALALRHAFGSLLIQQERVVTLRDARRDLERAAGIVSGRHDAGDASSYDALRVDIELRAKDAELGDAEGDLAAYYPLSGRFTSVG
jgi:cobalt-zinc-cadmium efflux system outer membrane protein